MIAVIGLPVLRLADPLPEPDGLVVSVAIAARRAGAEVELIGKVGNDPAGDALVLGLARTGVRHVATLRDPARSTPQRPDAAESLDPVDDAQQLEGAPELEGADVDLALRYLSDIRVIVAIHPPAAVRDVVVEAAGWSSAHLVLVVEPGTDLPSPAPAEALVVEATRADAASAIGEALGRYAAAIDRGDAPASAYAAFVAAARP